MQYRHFSAFLQKKISLARLSWQKSEKVAIKELGEMFASEIKYITY